MLVAPSVAFDPNLPKLAGRYLQGAMFSVPFDPLSGSAPVPQFVQKASPWVSGARQEMQLGGAGGPGGWAGGPAGATAAGGVASDWPHSVQNRVSVSS